MTDTKAEKIAIEEYKSKKLATAVNNTLVTLRNMGLTNSKVKVDEQGSTAYIAINVEDVVALLAKNCAKNVKKACGNTVETIGVFENPYIVIRVRKNE